MEYASKGSLRNIIQNSYKNKISNELIKFTIAEIVLGLEHMHQKKICHRDLKPDNILYDANYHVKICDFGEAKLFATLNRQ